MPHAFSTAMANSRALKDRWTRASHTVCYSPLDEFKWSPLSYSVPAMDIHSSLLFFSLPVLCRNCMCSCSSWCWFWLARWCRTRRAWCSSRFTVSPYPLPKSCWRTCPTERPAVLDPSVAPLLAMTKVNCTAHASPHDTRSSECSCMSRWRCDSPAAARQKWVRFYFGFPHSEVLNINLELQKISFWEGAGDHGTQASIPQHCWMIKSWE